MKGTNKIIQVFVLILLSCISLNAQDMKEDLRVMVQAFSKLKDFKFKAQVKVDYAEAGTVDANFVINYTTIGDKFRMEDKDKTTYYDGKAMLIIDHLSKLITYDRSYMGVFRNIATESIEELEKQFPGIRYWEYKGTNNGVKEYVWMETGKIINLVHLYLNEQTMLPNRIRMDYNEGLQHSVSSVDVNYEFEMLKDKKSLLFDPSTYIIVKGNNVTLNSKYKNYRLVVF